MAVHSRTVLKPFKEACKSKQRLHSFLLYESIPSVFKTSFGTCKLKQMLHFKLNVTRTIYFFYNNIISFILSK